MECREAQELFLQDLGEATPERQEAEAHLRACRACAQALRMEDLLSKRIRTALPLTPAAATLRQRVEAIVYAPPKNATIWSSLWRVTGGKTVVIATLVLLAFSLWFLFSVNRARTEIYRFATLLVDDHIENENRTMDLDSEEPAALRGYFQSRLPFTFPVPRPVGTRLQGGRLCFLAGDRAALIRYKQEATPISYFATEGPGLSFPAGVLARVQNKEVYIVALRGYRVAMWRHDGLLLAVVTDSDDQQFERLVRQF
jgi:anti-sigma factor RsiW